MNRKLLGIVLLLALALCCATAFADEEWAEYHCAEEGFRTRIPVAGNSGFEENTGLVIYTDVPGYIPYVIVSRRPLDMKFSNPTNYLSNVYREYLEGKHEDTGTNPARTWEIGGKQLLGARYTYHLGEYQIWHLQLIEIRDGGDVEYTAKYVDGQGEATLAALDAAVRWYQEDGEGADSPAATAAPGAGILEPIADPGAEVDTKNGVYWARITDLDHILDGGFFTAELYEQEKFDAASVEALKAGDRVRLNGTVYTVSSLARPWWKSTETEWELIPEETLPEGSWIGFEKGEGDFYYGVMDNYRTTYYLTDVPVWMPLPYAFSFVYIVNENDVTVFDADKFVEFAKDGDEFVDDLGPESTVIQFEDGLVTRIATQER